jgi:hypothetical protein
VLLSIGEQAYDTGRVDWMMRVAKEDLILHYCRYCGHRWDTAPLDAQGEKAKDGGHA